MNGGEKVIFITLEVRHEEVRSTVLKKLHSQKGDDISFHAAILAPARRNG